MWPISSDPQRKGRERGPGRMAWRVPVPASPSEYMGTVT